MKKLTLIRIFAAFLAIWYCISLAGINVHACSHTGKCYVTLLCNGVSCEDIHHGDCGCECEGHHHHHSSAGDDGCCHNDSYQLTFTSDDHGYADRILHPGPVPDAAGVPVMPAAVTPYPSIVPTSFILHDGTVPDTGILCRFCVRRI